MSLLHRLCYIGFHVLEKEHLAKDLVSKFGFELFATRKAESSRQLALRRGDAIFVVNEKRQVIPGEVASESSSDSGILYDVDLQYSVSTASNIGFETEDVPGFTLSLQERGCQILIPPTTVADEDGCVIYSVVKSIVGNISHTLLDRSQYCGPFLPGFQVEKDALKKFQKTGEITHFDHITFVCPQGSTQALLEWYETCFDFQRFLVHKQDDVAEGYVIHGAGVGLRLTAMWYSGLDQDCKFILAESMPGQSHNQVDNFLEQHGGAGIQHIALYTTDIISTVAAMAKSGVNFVKTPVEYYTEKRKMQEIQRAGQDIQLLKDRGILLDAAVDGEGDHSDLHGKQFLMQIFTKPLFREETFFLEVIERCGAAGFGEGNIRALWQAVQNYMGHQ
ncbi:4-hydroxyphenylpyruvate dioxygenase-like protein [Anolis carolinensis]|uniref:4-hydroxyphenylpyruvate dioxygenase n=1 Tax=Anolis carolinensis TaxID=28377 RepID=A0A803STW3_ANOCA|nr:PREDICTED: 4-hydroxyphenylpyruvate dioxygenase-like protein [Anolis carolinensis]|eukprot:XP_008107732.1 PREDICTED: 4-hydroxyphenylpyruvate dioxygenase-like protein [Anolis carolinensis]